VENEGIPVNFGDLPIESAVLEDDRPYKVELTKVTLALKTDKNGNVYCAIQCAVLDDDYEGLPINRSYLALPIGVSADAPKKMRIRVQNHNAPFGRFVRSFKLKSSKPMPAVLDVRDEVARTAWQEYMEQFIGAHGEVTVENSEFPAGSGRVRSAINDFV